MLFSAPAGAGHLLPLVPLAKAAMAEGHDVLFGATGPNLSLAARAGLTVVNVAPASDVTAVFGQLNEDTQVAGTPEAQMLDRAAAGWARIGDLVLDGMVTAIEGWQADVVVYEPYHVAAPVAADLCGVPSVLHGTGVPMRTFWPALERMARGPRSAEPAACVTVCPSSFTTSRRDRGWPMRYVPSSLDAPLPEWGPPTAPRVCVTFGSVLPGLRSHDQVRATLDALQDLDVEVVLSTGGADFPGEPPAHTRWAPWLPMSRVIPTCAAVIHHGGSGTTFGTMAAGVPQVVLPQGADQPVNAAAVARRGIGIALDAGDADRGMIRDAVRDVLDDPRYRAAARDLADENASRPSPTGLVGRIADLLGDGGRRR